MCALEYFVFSLCRFYRIKKMYEEKPGLCSLHAPLRVTISLRERLENEIKKYIHNNRDNLFFRSMYTYTPVIEHARTSLNLKISQPKSLGFLHFYRNSVFTKTTQGGFPLPSFVTVWCVTQGRINCVRPKSVLKRANLLYRRT